MCDSTDADVQRIFSSVFFLMQEFAFVVINTLNVFFLVGFLHFLMRPHDDVRQRLEAIAAAKYSRKGDASSIEDP